MTKKKSEVDYVPHRVIFNDRPNARVAGLGSARVSKPAKKKKKSRSRSADARNRSVGRRVAAKKPADAETLVFAPPLFKSPIVKTNQFIPEPAEADAYYEAERAANEVELPGSRPRKKK